MRITSKPHKCMTRNTNNAKCHFCAYCGSLMSKVKTGLKYYRSNRFNVVDLYRLDGNTMLEQMLKKQNVNRHYNPSASYVKHRDEQIKFMEYLAERFEYSHCTFYLGVGLLDAVLSQHILENNQTKLVCFTLLNLAAKMEEKGEIIPDVSTIVDLFENKFDIEEIVNCEIALCNILKYNLDLKTSFAFAEYFMSKGVLSSLDITQTNPEDIEKKITSFEREVNFLIDITTLNYDFYNYSPSVVAASAICVAKKLQGYKADWSHDLENLTGQKFTDIKECCNLLYSRYAHNYKINNLKIQNNFPSRNSRSNSNISSKTNKSVTSLQTMSDQKSSKQFQESLACMTIDTDEDEPVKNNCKFSSKMLVRN